MTNKPDRFCVYCFCGEPEAMKDKSHLFPKSIGGTVTEYYSCKKCNNTIGSKIEGLVPDNVFFAYGRKKFNLENKVNAVNRLRPRDKDTGAPFELTDEGLRPVNARRGNITSGSSDFTFEMALKEISKRRPGWVDSFKRQYREKSLNSNVFHIKVCDLVYRFETIQAPRKIVISGNSNFPWKLIAKIVYEGMTTISGWPIRLVGDLYDSTFILSGKACSVDRIDVANGFLERLAYTPRIILTDPSSYRQAQFQPYHKLDFRVTPSGVALVRIVFFGVLKFAVVVGRFTKQELATETTLDEQYIFPLRQWFYQMTPPNTAEYESFLKWEDNWAEEKISTIEPF